MFDCICPKAGFCERHNRKKGGREHQICKGENVSTSDRDTYLARWEREAKVPSKAVVTVVNSAHVFQPRALPGTELAKLLSWFRQTSGCGCQERAALMDRNGPDWCESHIDEIVGWMTEAASKAGVAGYIASLVPGVGLAAKEIVKQAIANARKNARAVRPQVREQAPKIKGEPIDRSKLVKHLLWHFYPADQENAWVWKKHAKLICQLAKDFNGRKLVTIVTKGKKDRHELAELDDVLAEFDQTLGIEFLTVENNTRLGEGASFITMLAMIESTDPNEVFFYGHNKGVTHGDQPPTAPPHLWADAMYETVMFNQDEAIKVLDTRAMAGSFVSPHTMIKMPELVGKWFFAGTFFAGRSRDVFARQWRYIPKAYGCVEMWPGILFEAHEIGTLFHIHASCLYQPHYWANDVTPALQRWRDGERIRRPIDQQHRNTRFVYKSMQQVMADINDWCDRLPPIGAVAGIPRSGCLVASAIALRKQIPLLSIDALMTGKSSYRKGGRPLKESKDPTLVVDDTCWTGSHMQDVRDRLKGPGYIFGALYRNPDSPGVIETWGEILTTPRHTFEYNFLRDYLAKDYVLDFDGVLCLDWNGRDEEAFEDEYRSFCETSPAKHMLPLWDVRAIVTGRPRAYEKETRQWLVNNGVKCGELIMPFATIAERKRHNVAAVKAREYQRLAHAGATLFVESEASQAAEIFRLTSLPVFSIETNTLQQA